MLRRVRNLYALCYLVFALLGLGLVLIVHVNPFAEIGAILIVIALLRGSWQVRNLHWSDDNLVNLLEEHQKIALKWDVAAGVVGTIVNGFSNGLFALLMLAADTKVEECNCDSTPPIDNQPPSASTSADRSEESLPNDEAAISPDTPAAENGSPDPEEDELGTEDVPAPTTQAEIDCL